MTRLALALLAVLLFTVPAFAQEEEKHAGWLHAAIAAHVVAQVADVSTTSWALGRFPCDERGRSLTNQTQCFSEANPLFRWAAKDAGLMGVVKGVFAAGSSYALLKMHKKYPKRTLVAAIVMAAGTGLVAHRNAQAIRKASKSP